MMCSEFVHIPWYQERFRFTVTSTTSKPVSSRRWMPPRLQVFRLARYSRFGRMSVSSALGRNKTRAAFLLIRRAIPISTCLSWVRNKNSVSHAASARTRPALNALSIHFAQLELPSATIVGVVKGMAYAPSRAARFEIDMAFVAGRYQAGRSTTARVRRTRRESSRFGPPDRRSSSRGALGRRHGLSRNIFPGEFKFRSQRHRLTPR